MNARYFVALLVVFSGAVGAKAAPKLMELIPDDAAGAIYVDRPQRATPPALMNPLAGAIAPDAKTAERLVEAVRRTPGPVMVGIIPPPGGREPFYFAAMDTTAIPGEFDEYVEKTLLPAVEGMRGKGNLKLEKSATVRRVVDPARGDEPMFVYAVKDKVALASNHARLVQDWLAGAWPKKRFVQLPGVREAVGKLPKQFVVRGYFNTKWLVDYLGKPQAGSTDETLRRIFEPEDLQFAAVDLDWQRDAMSVRLAVGLTEECKGLARFLARAPSASRCLGVFPEDFTAIGRIGFGAAQDAVEGAYSITDRFDPNISKEYREELAEFSAESGVDWSTDVMGNVVGELAVGLRVDFTRSNPFGWAAVCPLTDGTKFSVAIDKLVAHFGLTFADTQQGTLRVRVATGTYPFCLAVANGRLIVADSPVTAEEIAKRAAEERAEPASEGLRKFYAELGPTNQLAVMLDIGKLREKVPILPMMVGPEGARLLGGGSAGLAATVKDRIAQVEFKWQVVRSGGKRRGDGDDDERHARVDGESGNDKGRAGAAGDHGEGDEDELFTALVGPTVARLQQVRDESRRMVVMANMRGVGQGLFIYAQGHGDSFPSSLKDLIEGGTVSLETFTDPYTGRAPSSTAAVEHEAYIIYRPGLSARSDPKEIVLAERQVREGQTGACFLFVNGHGEFIEEPRATELIELMQSNAAEVRR